MLLMGMFLLVNDLFVIEQVADNTETEDTEYDVDHTGDQDIGRRYSGKENVLCQIRSVPHRDQIVLGSETCEHAIETCIGCQEGSEEQDHDRDDRKCLRLTCGLCQRGDDQDQSYESKGFADDDDECQNIV